MITSLTNLHSLYSLFSSILIFTVSSFCFFAYVVDEKNRETLLISNRMTINSGVGGVNRACLNLKRFNMVSVSLCIVFHSFALRSKWKINLPEDLGLVVFHVKSIFLFSISHTLILRSRQLNVKFELPQKVTKNTGCKLRPRLTMFMKYIQNTLESIRFLQSADCSISTSIFTTNHIF